MTDERQLLVSALKERDENREATGRFVVMPRDVAILGWSARFGMVTAQQIHRRYFSSIRATWRRLGCLERAGLIHRDRAWWGMPEIVRASAAGGRLADVDLGVAPLDYVRLRHNLAVVDLAEDLLAEHAGARWTTERELRRDRVRAAKADRDAYRHRVPDGLMVLSDDRRVAVELDLTPKRSRRLDALAASYAMSLDIDEVWWFLPSEKACTRMCDVVRGRGLESLIKPRLRQVRERREGATGTVRITSEARFWTAAQEGPY